MADFKPLIIEALKIMQTGQFAEKTATSRFKAMAYGKVIKQLQEMAAPVRSQIRQRLPEMFKSPLIC